MSGPARAAGGVDVRRKRQSGRCTQHQLRRRHPSARATQGRESVSGNAHHADPACIIKDGTNADFPFGVVYTGDIGIETDGSGKSCIVQSRMEYTSFKFVLSLMDPNEGLIKDQPHMKMDTKVVQSFFPTTTPSGRCSRWRVMPAGA
jgi:hypothetical protein